ncbi:MAG: hypothetical protein Q4B81_07020, partial [Moraxella sp.]|nr:hypothetical protein [Moraxella sp.]
QNNDNDKREKIMSLTDKGKDFAKPIIENLLNQENQVIRQFGEQRMAFLLSELSQLQQALSDQFEQNDAE